MTIDEQTRQIAETIRTLRQARQYHPGPVPAEVVDSLLEIARWSGSSRNTQPWHFITIDDRETLFRISRFLDRINWVAEAPLAIAIVLDGENPVGEAYDEGRVTERILTAARFFGLGGGIAWYGSEENEAEAKRLLGIPADRTARSIVALGYPVSFKDPRPMRNTPGRKLRSAVVSYNRMGNPEP